MAAVEDDWFFGGRFSGELLHAYVTIDVFFGEIFQLNCREGL